MRERYYVVVCIKAGSVTVFGDRRGKPFTDEVNATRSMSKRRNRPGKDLEGTWTVMELSS